MFLSLTREKGTKSALKGTASEWERPKGRAALIAGLPLKNPPFTGEPYTQGLSKPFRRQRLSTQTPLFVLPLVPGHWQAV